MVDIKVTGEIQAIRTLVSAHYKGRKTSSHYLSYLKISNKKSNVQKKKEMNLTEANPKPMVKDTDSLGCLRILQQRKAYNTK